MCCKRYHIISLLAEVSQDEAKMSSLLAEVREPHHLFKISLDL